MLRARLQEKHRLEGEVDERLAKQEEAMAALQSKVAEAEALLSMPCESCREYEQQIQALNDRIQTLKRARTALDEQLQQARTAADEAVRDAAAADARRADEAAARAAADDAVLELKETLASERRTHEEALQAAKEKVAEERKGREETEAQLAPMRKQLAQANQVRICVCVSVCLSVCECVSVCL